MSIRLYVGNLSYSTTQEELAEIFSEAGSVANASLMTDRYSGQSRGFGFIEMATDDEAQNAIRILNGRNVGGRDLVVNEARPRTEGGGFGGARGGNARSSSYGGSSGAGGYDNGGGERSSDRGDRGGRRNADRFDRDRY
jgi:RNA recognition motif-containing protein